ncbi:MAG: DUF1599 domain-containing protein [Sphingobacteriia bacterium]|jgi:hypothetical protein
MANLPDTEAQFDAIVASCRRLFAQKTEDYGAAWTILRLPSLTDQIFIKAKRIRTLEIKGESRVGEGIEPEYVGIINYCVMALILHRQPELQPQGDVLQPLRAPVAEVLGLYDAQVAAIRSTLLKKNHDYGEAWRDMRPASFTDLILMKLLRIKQIEDHQGETRVSEGVDAGYEDIVNYSVFALIRRGWPIPV